MTQKPAFQLNGVHVVLGVVVLVSVVVLVAQVEIPPPSAEAIARDRQPGVTRVGESKAAELWAGVESTPGVQRWSCSAAGLCSVMFDPNLWRRMDYDLKRDFTASMGIAFARGQNANWTSIRDRMTNRELADYSTMHDKVNIK